MTKVLLDRSPFELTSHSAHKNYNDLDTERTEIGKGPAQECMAL